jgi:uncharacterized protein YhfF
VSRSKVVLRHDNGHARRWGDGDPVGHAEELADLVDDGVYVIGQWTYGDGVNVADEVSRRGRVRE